MALLSLAGIPLTAGFIGKFYLFMIGVDASLWGLLLLLVLGSAISIYYYLRIIFAMTRTAGEVLVGVGAEVSISSRLVYFTLVAAMLYLGVAPDALMTHLATILG